MANLKQLPCTIEIDGRYFFLIKAKCISCDEEHLLFDADFHGWEGFVCHDPEQASLPRPPLTSWKCPGCGSSEHSASIEIETQGKEDFVTETDGEFAEDLWPDAFTWFDMSITCCDCGQRIDQWVSYETA